MVPKTQKKCSVCSDPEISDNEIFSCISCKTNVHRLCYGIESIFNENWKCSPCKDGLRNVTCKLCLQKDGSFKKTDAGGWVHVICGLFTDGVVFEDPQSMEPINIQNVSQNKRNKTCVYCRKSCGFCCLCSNGKCNNRLHITCAQRAHALKEEIKKDDTIKFRAFCMDHKPSAKERRITSGSVRRKSLGVAQIAKKTIDKTSQMTGAKLNAQWIVAAAKNANGDKSPVHGAFDETLERTMNNEGESSKCGNVDESSKENANPKSASNGILDEISQKSRASNIVVDSQKKKTNRKRIAENDMNQTPKQTKPIENRSADKTACKAVTESTLNVTTGNAGMFNIVIILI